MIIILTYPIVITCKRPGHVLEILRGIMEAVWGVGATGPETVTGIGAPLCRDRQRAAGATSSRPFCADSSGQHRCRIGWRPRPHCRIVPEPLTSRAMLSRT